MKRTKLLVSLAAAACAGNTESPWVAPGPGEVAGVVVSSEDMLFGGISAEGQLGDVLLQNAKVRFVIQGLRDGGYYVRQGGGVLDADIIRPDGAPGRDLVDDWMVMPGLGRILDPVRITVESDGEDGAARVRVVGTDIPLELASGATEADIFPAQGLTVLVDYVLRPDTQFLEVTTQVIADRAVSFAPGDILFGAVDIAEAWDEGFGLDTPASGPHAFTALVSEKGPGALAIAAAPGTSFSPGAGGILAELADLQVAFLPTQSLAAGERFEWTRLWGVAPDLAAMTTELLERSGESSEVLEDVVRAPDGPVAGARVHVLVDGEPWSMALTDADGAFSMRVPEAGEVTVLAEGRGRGYFFDLPSSIPSYGPYAAEPARLASLAALEAGVAGYTARAAGRGIGTAEEPLALGEPAELLVRDTEGGPFEVRLQRLDSDPEVDSRLVARRPRGGAVGWARDGEVRLLVEPGTYRAVIHRGSRYEAVAEEVALVAGANELEVSLTRAYEHPGWLLGDPHMHASPSGDANIAMEERLVGAAAVGLQLHFGTDHDHVVDYRPLLDPLGLSEVLGSVVSSEFSPTLRGHHNIYPLSVLEDRRNGGAVLWWEFRVDQTVEQHLALRERHGDIVIQSNHPLSGLTEAANWSVGAIGRGDFWSTEIDSMEVMNNDSYEALAVYLDLVSRGQLLAAIGVSDSHGHTNGSLGISATFLEVGVDSPSEMTDEMLVDAVRGLRTQVTRGPFLSMSIRPGEIVGAGSELEVEALAPSWVRVDRLILLRDGEAIETVEGRSATFTLDATEDALFNVRAEGDTPMQPVSGATPWAFSSPILVDVEGDGWEAPLPPLVVDP